MDMIGYILQGKFDIFISRIFDFSGMLNMYLGCSIYDRRGDPLGRPVEYIFRMLKEDRIFDFVRVDINDGVI